VRLRVGTVGHVRVAVGAFLEFVEDPPEDPLAIPAGEFVVNGVPWTESLRQVSPRNARLGDVEDRVHEGAVGQTRWPSTATCLGWQQGFDSGPFRITQFVSVHSQTKATGCPLGQIFGQSVSGEAARRATPAASSLSTATTITT
jgi:hypothetical protein